MNCNDPECLTGGDHGEPWRCSAHKTKRDPKTGKKVPCRGSHLKGSTVCVSHGVNEKTRKSARQRLDDMIDPLLSAMTRAVKRYDEQKGLELHPGLPRLAALILDRTGFGKVERVEFIEADNKEGAWFSRQVGEKLVAVVRDLTHTLASVYNFNPYDPKVIKAMRLACEAAEQGSDGPIRSDEAKQTWLAHATPEERVQILAIMEASVARRAGKEVESLVAPEAGNGHEAPPERPVPRGEPAATPEEPDEVTL